MNAPLLGVIAALCWGLHDFLARSVARGIGERLAVFIVMAIGSALLSFWLFGFRALPSISAEELWLPIITGAAYAFATLSLYAALTIGRISLVAPIVGSYPALNLLMAVYFDEWPQPLAWAGVALVMLGVFGVARFAVETQNHAVEDDQSSIRPGLPILLSVISALMFATSFAVGQTGAPLYGDVEITWMARLAGVAVMGLVLIGARQKPVNPRQFWPLLILMGILDVTAFAAVLSAGNLANAEIAAVTSSAFGMVTVSLARIILREPISAIQWIAILSVFIGDGILIANA